jgi:2-amino-4-hydroxy-6-hydroxymethyldihydropteridine diphosphokinase
MPKRPNSDCLIAFGSNLGSEKSVLHHAIAELDSIDGIRVTAVSRPVWTAAVGGPAGQPDYLNAVIRLETSLHPRELLRQTLQIEQNLGRDRRQRWGARKIDLDILLMGESQLQSPELTIPHPRMSFRRFVLEPAAEIAAEMEHPVCSKSIGELLDHLNQKPNEIVLVIRNAQSDRIYRNLLDHPVARKWTIHVVQTVAEFEHRRIDAKLVVWGNPLPQPFQTDSFRGPALQSPASDEDAIIEIVAAMTAMGGETEGPRGT